MFCGIGRFQSTFIATDARFFCSVRVGSNGWAKYTHQWNEKLISLKHQSELHTYFIHQFCFVVFLISPLSWNDDGATPESLWENILNKSGTDAGIFWLSWSDDQRIWTTFTDIFIVAKVFA